MNTIKHSEEHLGTVTLFLTNGHKVEFETEKLITFIEKNKLNISYTGKVLMCDPNGTEEEIALATVADFLDQNWDFIIENYYKQIICKA